MTYICFTIRDTRIIEERCTYSKHKLKSVTNYYKNTDKLHNQSEHSVIAAQCRVKSTLEICRIIKVKYYEIRKRN